MAAYLKLYRSGKLAERVQAARARISRLLSERLNQGSEVEVASPSNKAETEVK